MKRGGWLLGACLAALALALIRLGHPGLWCDEIYTSRWTDLSFSGLMDALRHDLHPPVYFVLESFAVRLWGRSEWGLRLLSVLAGAGAVAATFWAFRPIVNARTAAATAWLLALSPQFFLYGRMARYYSLAALVAMIAHGLFVRLAVGRGKPRSWFLYGVGIALMLYTSYVSVCLALAHAVWALASKGRRDLMVRWLGAVFIGGALFLPWAFAVVEQMRFAHSLKPAAVNGPASFALLLAFDFHALSASELLFPWEPLGILGILCGGWLMLTGGLAAVRRGLGRSVLLPAAAALGLAWIVVSSLAHATPFVGLPARTLFLWPFGAVLLAIGALDPAQRFGLRVTATAGLLLVWAVGWLHLYQGRHYLNLIYLTPGREVAQRVMAEARPDDLVLSEDDSGANYYLLRQGFKGPLLDPVDLDAARRALEERRPARVWWVKLSRDGSERVRPSAGTEALLAGWGTLASREGFLEVDPVLRALKRRLLGLPPATHRVLLERFDRAERTAAAPIGAQEGASKPPINVVAGGFQEP